VPDPQSPEVVHPDAAAERRVVEAAGHHSHDAPSRVEDGPAAAARDDGSVDQQGILDLADLSDRDGRARDPALEETVELLGADSFRHDGLSLDLDGLEAALARPADLSNLDPEPLRLVVPEEAPLDELRLALDALLLANRSHLILELAGQPARSTTLPILVSHACGAVFYHDGVYTYDEHAGGALDEGLEGSPDKVLLRVARGEGGALVADHLEYAEDEGRTEVEWDDVSADVRGGAPPVGAALDLAAVRRWFATLHSLGVKPLLCLDYRSATTAGELVDALRAEREGAGHDLLLGPSAWEEALEPEEEEEELEVEGR